MATNPLDILAILVKLVLENSGKILALVSTSKILVDTLAQGAIYIQELNKQKEEAGRVVNTIIHYSPLNSEIESIIREKFSSLTREQFRTIYNKYLALKSASSSSNQTKTLTQKCLSQLKDDAERAKLVLDYLYNGKNVGRTFYEVLKEHIEHNIIMDGESSNDIELDDIGDDYCLVDKDEVANEIKREKNHESKESTTSNNESKEPISSLPLPPLKVAPMQGEQSNESKESTTSNNESKEPIPLLSPRPLKAPMHGHSHFKSLRSLASGNQKDITSPSLRPLKVPPIRGHSHFKSQRSLASGNKESIALHSLMPKKIQRMIN